MVINKVIPKVSITLAIDWNFSPSNISQILLKKFFNPSNTPPFSCSGFPNPSIKPVIPLIKVSPFVFTISTSPDNRPPISLTNVSIVALAPGTFSSNAVKKESNIPPNVDFIPSHIEFNVPGISVKAPIKASPRLSPPSPILAITSAITLATGSNTNAIPPIISPITGNFSLSPCIKILILFPISSNHLEKLKSSAVNVAQIVPNPLPIADAIFSSKLEKNVGQSSIPSNIG